MRIMLAAVSALALAACNSAPADAPDMIFHNGVIYTGVDGPCVSAAAVDWSARVF